MAQEDVRRILLDAGIETEIADAIAAHSRRLDPIEDRLELEALLHRPAAYGAPAKVWSVRLTNTLLNWRETLLLALPALVAAGAAGNAVAVAAGLLSALAALINAASVPIEDDHARLVLALWRDRPDMDRVRVVDAAEALGLPEAKVRELLIDLLPLGIVDLGDEGESIVKRDQLFLTA